MNRIRGYILQDESQKFRKKMYKSGKFWVAAGALFVGLAFAGEAVG